MTAVSRVASGGVVLALRLSAVAIAIVALGLVIVQPAKAQTAVTTTTVQETTTTLVSAQPTATLEVNFGLAREPLTRSLTLTFDTDDPSTIGDVSIELLGDLKRKGGGAEFPADQVTPSASVSGTTARVAVVVDPLVPEEVDAGDYSGKLRISGEGIETDEVQLRILLEARSGTRLYWAGMILFLGAVFGAVVRWTNEIGQALGSLRRRLRRIIALLADIDVQDLPSDVARSLKTAKVALSQREIEPARGALDKLERAVGFEGLAGQLRTIRQSIEVQETIARRFQVYSQCQAAIRKERSELDSIRLTPADAIDAGSNRARALVHYASGIEALIRRLATIVDESASGAVGSKSGGSSFDEISKLLASVSGVGDLGSLWTPELDDAIRGLPVPSKRVRSIDVSLLERPIGLPLRAVWRWFRRLFDARNMLLIAASFLVMLLGLEQQYFNNPAFDGHVARYIALFAWAAGIQIVGVEIAQLGSRLYQRLPTSETDNNTGLG